MATRFSATRLGLLASWLASCAPADTSELTPLDEAPPPPTLQVSGVVPGYPQHLRATAPRGSRVVFLRSAFLPEPGLCPPLLRGACLGIVAPRVIADVRANSRGEAVAVVTTPADMARPGVASFQALAILPRSAVPSPVIALAVLAADDDGDRDGLDAAGEAEAGTDVSVPDSDGGGTIDGQEVLIDHTDPHDPRDDVRTEADCDDRIDGDGDGTADEGDTDCPHHPGEVCDNGIDDNGDHYADCLDLECLGHPTCAEGCNDRRDNDIDNAVDCRDADCATSASCEHRCNAGFDEDGDRLIDCLDPDCAGTINCPLQNEICNDHVDNNRNSLVDCLDPACQGTGLCVEQCRDGVDNNTDGLADSGDHMT